MEDELSNLSSPGQERSIPGVQMRAILGRIGLRSPSQNEQMKFTLAIFIILSLTVPVAAQAPTSKVWRTPWGDPDLQGSWSNATTTPLQRPAQFAGREFLTPEERRNQD